MNILSSLTQLCSFLLYLHHPLFLFLTSHHPPPPLIDLLVDLLPVSLRSPFVGSHSTAALHLFMPLTVNSLGRRQESRGEGRKEDDHDWRDERRERKRERKSGRTFKDKKKRNLCSSGFLSLSSPSDATALSLAT